MTITYGTAMEDGRNESYVESDEFTFQGNSYLIRITALRPYKDYVNNSDALYCHIDFHNLDTDEKGRFSYTTIPDRNPAETNGHLRRHSAYRHLQQLLATETPDPSPVFP